MSEDLDELVGLLDLEQIEVNIFRGTQPDEERQRVFGGQVAAQALVAAGRTVEQGEVHSLHSYFLRPGDPSIPILYEVDRIRDERLGGHLPAEDALAQLVGLGPAEDVDLDLLEVEQIDELVEVL